MASEALRRPENLVWPPLLGFVSLALGFLGAYLLTSLGRRVTGLATPTEERTFRFVAGTFNYGYIGQRATGPEAGDYLVVGPGWKGETPAGIKKVFHSSTQFSAVAYRTQLFNPQDMQNVVKVQSGYKVQPLSAYLKKPAPPAARPALRPAVGRPARRKRPPQPAPDPLQPPPVHRRARPATAAAVRSTDEPCSAQNDRPRG